MASTRAKRRVKKKSRRADFNARDKRATAPRQFTLFLVLPFVLCDLCIDARVEVLEGKGIFLFVVILLLHTSERLIRRIERGRCVIEVCSAEGMLFGLVSGESRSMGVGSLK